MIVRDELLKRLRSAFDLNIYEVKIWTALLSKGMATAGELSEISNVPRSRSYDILESLEKKGFVIMKLGKPIKYLAVKPVEVIKRVKRSIDNKAVEHAKMLDNVEATDFFKELDLLYKNGIEHIDPSEFAGSVKGRDNIYDQIETLLSNAKKNVVLMTTASGLKRKTDAFENLFKRLSSNGVKIRVVAPVTKDNEEIIKRISKYADFKNIDDVKARFCIVDSKQMVFMVSDDSKVHENYDTGIWVNSEFFVNALMDLFEYSWTRNK